MYIGFKGRRREIRVQVPDVRALVANNNSDLKLYYSGTWKLKGLESSSNAETAICPGLSADILSARWLCSSRFQCKKIATASGHDRSVFPSCCWHKMVEVYC